MPTAAEPSTNSRSHSERSTFGHLKGLQGSQASSRLLTPTVSSRLKVKGAEGFQLTQRQPQQQQQQKAQGSRPHQLNRQQQKQRQKQPQHGQQRAQELSTCTAIAGRAVCDEDGSAAAAAAEQQQQQHSSSLQAAKIRLGLNAGLGVAQVRPRLFSIFCLLCELSTTGMHTMVATTMPAAPSCLHCERSAHKHMLI